VKENSSVLCSETPRLASFSTSPIGRETNTLWVFDITISGGIIAAPEYDPKQRPGVARQSKEPAKYPLFANEKARCALPTVST
jgi:hypothetical protein